MTVTAPRPSVAPAAGTGGTLRLLGPATLAHLDPTGARQVPEGQVARLFSRQLVSYRAHPDPGEWQALDVVPDLALDVPSTYNLGLGANHRCYTIHLRPDAHWDTEPPRRVTAGDFVRGFKRMANPVLASPVLGYFAATVRGLAEFAAGFADACGSGATAAELAAYQDAHEIGGVFALDDDALVVELVRPALDFVHMLALAGAAAVPVEYDAYLPASEELHANLRSNGPYRLSAYVPGEYARFAPNPAWRAGSDPIRRRHLDAIDITMESLGPDEVAARIAGGGADHGFGPAEALPVAPAAPEADGPGWSLGPYLALNFAGSPALADLRVRQAIAAAVDRDAIARIYRRHGHTVQLAAGLVPPGNVAHAAAEREPGQPEPDRARRLLAAAGHDELALTALHADTAVATEVARAYAADLDRAGIRVRLAAAGAGELHRRLTDPAGTSGWDLAALTRAPDWHPHNGRVFVQALVAGDGAANYGRYRSPAVDDLVERAHAAAAEPPAAEELWRRAAGAALADVALVPLLHLAPAMPRVGPRVRGARVLPALGHAVDLANVWVAAAGPPGRPAPGGP